MQSKVKYYLNCLTATCCLLLLLACQEDSSTSVKYNEATSFQLFQQVAPDHSNVDFENGIIENNRINILNYLYYYNGSGVAVGDINQDGLPDIYFGATTNKNKLYINKGNLQFEDITSPAGVEGDFGITAGVSFIDINNDGWLDIYICKSGDQSERYRTNQLFVNNGNLTFSERAKEYGLDDTSFSNQAYFFDMDQDGDLDMYLVNHPVDWPNINKIMTGDQNKDGFHYGFSDKLYRNNGNGKFKDVTEKAGVLNRSWGLSAAIGDFNEDQLLDIYVANDFIKPDYLYINQGDGTFKNEIQQYFRHISFFSMGTDLADINNDGHNDLYVADMAMNGHTRSKRNMGSMSTENFQAIVRRGYHYPYSTNTLQLNVQKNTFADIALAARVAKTDWSWAPLIMDFDNDGYKDIFVTNGIYRDIIDNDFLTIKASYDEKKERNYFDDLIQDIPQTKVYNFLFQNQGDLTFNDLSAQWGMNQPSNSNGAVYADLDMDGDLDLICNNLNESAQIYENTAAQKLNNHYLKVKLTGSAQNRNAIGTQVFLQSDTQQQRIDMQVTRGYLSSVDYVLHFGLGQQHTVDKLKVIWPDGKTTVVTHPEIDATHHIRYQDAKEVASVETESEMLFENQTAAYGLDFLHQEIEYDDFKKELLLPHKLSQNGPFLSVADVNSDGLEDFYIGGAAGYTGTLFLQNDNKTFVKSNIPAFINDKQYEDQKSLFFDVDQDGDLDLFVVSGSNEFSNVSLLQDRLYMNDGNGHFKKATNALPRISSSGMAVAACDYDRDGDQDLIIGGRVVPGKYPTPPTSMLLENQNGKFVDVSSNKAPDLQQLGMITDMLFTDYDNDGDKDLLVVGEWLPITLFKNENGIFKRKEPTSLGLSHTEGWWFSISEGDMDGDGNMDYIVGNIGMNNKYQPTPTKPLHIYYSDFDDNGSGDIVLSKKEQNILFPVRGRECSSQQMPFIKEKFPDFASFSSASMNEIYDPEKLASALHYKVYEFRSVLLKNQGNDQFEIQFLPPVAQLSPMMSTKLIDVNQDGYLDIIGGGNFYVTETETIRYDAGTGICLLGDGLGHFTKVSNRESGLLLQGDVRDLQIIHLSNTQKGLLVARNRGKLELFSSHEQLNY